VKEAMKSGDQEKSSTLRLALSSIGSKEKEKKYKENLEAGVELTDEEIISVLISEVKKRRDAIALYEKGNKYPFPQFGHLGKIQLFFSSAILSSKQSVTPINRDFYITVG